MATSESRPCAHADCKCTVVAGQDYCSDYCRQAAVQGRQQQAQSAAEPQTQGGAQCDCGHPACRHA
jgi:hypothetical protein